MTDETNTDVAAAEAPAETATTEAEAPKSPGRKKGAQQNGVTRPGPDTMIGKLWEIADSLSAAQGSPAARKQVVDKYLADVPGAVLATANTQYARWMTYYGLNERLKEAKAQRKAEKEQAKLDAIAKSNAEREQKKAALVEERAKAKAEREAKRTEKAQIAAANKAKRAEAAAAAAQAAEQAQPDTPAAA